MPGAGTTLHGIGYGIGYTVGHGLGMVVFVQRHPVAGGRGTYGIRVLFEPRFVVANQRGATADDRRSGAVVALQPIDRRAPPVDEVAHVLRTRMPPLVDGLVVVTYEQYGARRRREQVQQPELGSIGILRLVHGNVPQGAAYPFPQIVMGAQHPRREANEVGEVEQ